MTIDSFLHLYIFYKNCLEIKYCAVLFLFVLNNLFKKESISCHVLASLMKKYFALINDNRYRSKTSLGDLPIILDNKMPFPFEFILETLPPFATVYDLQEICRDEIYSFAGILIKMKRNSVGQLLCGYYYPTTSFALLSMISYLIKPEKVSPTRILQ